MAKLGQVQGNGQTQPNPTEPNQVEKPFCKSKPKNHIRGVPSTPTNDFSH